MTTQKMSLETLPGIVTKLIGQIITLQNAKAKPRDFVGKNKIKHISLCEISCLKEENLNIFHPKFFLKITKCSALSQVSSNIYNTEYNHDQLIIGLYCANCIIKKLTFPRLIRSLFSSFIFVIPKKIMCFPIASTTSTKDLPYFDFFLLHSNSKRQHSEHTAQETYLSLYNMNLTFIYKHV